MPVLAKPPECDPCPLQSHYQSRGFVPPWGHGLHGVTFWAEAAGEQEYFQSRPLVEWAPAGAIFERTLRHVAAFQEEDPQRELGALPNANRSEFRLMNTCNCRPKNNWLENAPWEAAAVAHCKVHRDREMLAHPPKAIVALGGVATRAATGMAGPKRGVTLLRGYVIPALDYRMADGSPVPVVPSIHPSAIRQDPKGPVQLVASYWDFRRALWVAKHGYRWQTPQEVLGVGNTGKAATREDIDEFIDWVADRNDREWPIFYDIETPWSANELEDRLEDARREFNNDLIESVQFWHHGQGLFIRDIKEFKDEIQTILDLPNPKAGWNRYLFDDPIMMGAGFRFGPEPQHDLMWMWHHSRPDLDANLQYAASFFNWPFPWKHFAQTQQGVYGLCDVAVLERIWERLPGEMRRDGIYRGYEEHVLNFRRELHAAELRGAPIDEPAREELDRTIAIERDRTFEEIQEMVPEGVKGLHPKQGYKVLPRVVKTSLAYERVREDFPGEQWQAQFLGELTHELGPPPIPGDSKNRTGQWHFHEFDDPSDIYTEAKVWRLCIRKPFLPNSSEQVKAYIRARGYKVPRSFKEDKETTAKKELERLGKKHDDPTFGKILEYREYEKIHSTYVVGWKPGADGKVHTQFTFRPATGQLSSINPNIQNGPKHGTLAKQWRKMIAAPPGFKIVEVDKSAFHVLTTGFEAGDELYMRLARIDPHSFLASHFKSVDFPPIDPKWPDDQIAEATAEVKKRFPHARNKQAKPGILGYGFGLGINNFFQQNRENFDGKMKGAREVYALLDDLFPTAKKWRNTIRWKAHQEGRLRSLHGYVRYFTEVLRWDSKRGGWVPGDHSEQAIAFLPANDAFGEMKDISLRLGARGLNERYDFFNTIHDSLLFCVPDGLVDACLQDVCEEMLRRSTVLISKEVPDGLWCGVEAEMGQNLAEMKTVLKTTYKGELVHA